jgi:hypothetical protein
MLREINKLIRYYKAKYYPFKSVKFNKNMRT